MLAHELLEADREIGARHAVAAMLEDEIAGRHLELLGGERHALADHLLGGDRQRTTMTDERARAERAGADQRRPVRVARAQRDGFRRDAENLADDVRKHRLMALARRARQRVELHMARGIEPDRGLLLAEAAGRLDEDGASDAGELAARFGYAAAALEAAPVRALQRLRQQPRRIAAVVSRAGRGLIGKGVLGQEVAAAQLDPVDAGDAARL